MKKVFISCPMRGLTDEEIKARMLGLKRKLADNMPVTLTFLDSFFGDYDGNAVQFLGKSIELLGRADIALFATGYEEARGCVIEHAVAEAYGISIIYEEDLV